MSDRPIRRDPDDGRIYVDGPEDIPEFASEEEEADFWETHTFSPESWEGATRGAPPGSLRARLIEKRRQAGHPAG